MNSKIETDSKRELILEGAIRRFSHFSIQKTTMNEIADDLSMSKPNLYYYFPDKTSLVIAVAEKITDEYLAAIDEEFTNSDAVDESLLKVIIIRNVFFKKYYMLHINDGQTEALFKDENLRSLMAGVKEKELALIAAQIREGKRQNLFKTIDVEKTTALFMDMLTGLQLCIGAMKSPVPAAEAFDETLHKQLEVARIFLDGIRRND
ncbi:MAG TPA: TetR family transcriptional regulator [Sphingobacteriaceae bacterium]